MLHKYRENNKTLKTYKAHSYGNKYEKYYEGSVRNSCNSWPLGGMGWLKPPQKKPRATPQATPNENMNFDTGT